MKNVSVLFYFVLIVSLVFFISDDNKNLEEIKNLHLKAVRQHSLATPQVRTISNISERPLYFIPNQGQVNKEAIFYAGTSKYTLWLTREGLVFDGIHRIEPEKESSKFIRDISRLIFLNTNKNIEIVPLEKTTFRVNYFKGKNPSQWYRNISTSKAVRYKNIYKNIHLHVYGREKQVEYDWIVKPGGNPGDIRLEFKNVTGTALDDDGRLVVETQWGEFIHNKPVSFQETNGVQDKKCKTKKLVNTTYKEINENIYGFEVGSYDRNAELIIDPVVLTYSTYLGGDLWEECRSIVVDNSGYAYVTGSTWSTDFPLRDQYQVDPGSENHDAFVTKIDTNGSGDSSLIYSTYLGGENSDSGSSIAFDNKGHVYVTGYTWSEDFPTKGAYQTYQGNGDVFVTRLDTTGNTAAELIYSTFLGGEQEDFGLGIAVDTKRNVYVAGWTYSLDFPTRNSFQAETTEDFTSGFFSRLDTSKQGASSLIYSTYLGGKGSDGGEGITVDSSGYAYITGWTYSPDFPVRNPFQADKGNVDAFVTKIDSSRSGISSLLYSTYLGGGQADYGKSIAVDSNNIGYVYVTGITRSTNFPTLNFYQKDQGGSDAFVTKLDTTKTGSACLLYSTYLGGENSDKGYGIAVDGNDNGNVYVTGVTESSHFPVHRSYQDYQGDADAFVIQLDTTHSGSSSLAFSTYLGGSSSDGGNGIAIDNNGNIFVTGWTLSTDFPALNQYRLDPGDIDYDGFVTRLFIEPEAPPSIRLSRDNLNFSAIMAGVHTPPQTFLISNSGGGSLNWSASTPDTWLELEPVTNTGDTIVTVSVIPANLAAGSIDGTITITDPNAVNSPKTVNVRLTVYNPGSTGPPFGHFSTPIDGSTVSSSIPVTGWVLDDIGVEHVKIFRGKGKSLIYIGDAVFVEGARPDIETEFPGYPLNYRAGWGYMMLTNFLPDGGNGTFFIHAIAEDTEGQQISLGTKTIIADNANAVKPFGAIDTPTQGGAASGNSFVNWGWVLTPLPNTIPIDGSTINVWVDGVNLGHPTYNIYRSDIAQLFPGYNNTDGAAGYFKLDTTLYSNGVHTIQWTATDDAGNTDGIGSRYFTIRNTGISAVQTAQPAGLLSEGIRVEPSYDESIAVKKGFDETSTPQEIFPDENGLIKLEIEELQPIEIRFERKIMLEQLSDYIGYQVVGHQLKPLPIGSYLDRRKGIFYWQPGPGYVGSFHLVFLRKIQPGEYRKITIRLNILPRHCLQVIAASR